MRKRVRAYLPLTALITAFTIHSTSPAFAQYSATNPGDSLALVDLFNSLGGPGWVGVTWDFSKPVRTWTNISFTNTSGNDPNSRIQTIGLSGRNLVGVLPASIGNLSELRDLALDNNQISGTIPASIGNLTKLRSIFLDYNQLEGGIPESFSNLGVLFTLSLTHNRLSEPLPAALGTLSNLGQLYLHHNRFNFDGFESIYSQLTATIIAADDQEPPVLHEKNGLLSVTVGGSLANNTYTWHNRDRFGDIIIKGDSTFRPVYEGKYWVTVKNGIARFTMTSTEIRVNKLYKVNPYPNFVDAQGNINTSFVWPETTIQGAAADGLTRILLTSYSELPLTISLDDPADGSLSTLTNQQVKSQSLTIAPTGPSYVQLIYNAPDGYGAAYPKGSRKVIIRTQNISGSEDTTQITLMSPPVVLVHGMWSTPDVWEDGGFVKALNGNGLEAAGIADYGLFSEKTFAPNDNESIFGRAAVASSVKSAITHYLEDHQVLATQVDIVGHSLGGLMSRSWSQQPGFAAKDNYFKGYIHKLITLGTPHRGSPLGPALWDKRTKIMHLHLSDHTTIPIPLILAAALVNKPIGTVHRDFGNTSAGINALTATLPFKTHAIIGDYVPTRILDYAALNLLTVSMLDRTMGSIFASRCNPDSKLSSDVIVPVSSQTGYIDHTTTFYGTTHSTILPILSSTETNNPDIQQKVMGLLLSNNPADFSSGFPTPSAQPLDCASSNQRQMVLTNTRVYADPQGKYAQITSPAHGSTVQAGTSTVTLAFTPGNGMVPDTSVFIIEGIGHVGLTGNERSVELALPASTIPKSFNVLLIAKDRDGITFADTISIQVNTPSSPDSISVQPSTVDLSAANRTGAVHVYGYYFHSSDTTKIELSQASGINYRAFASTSYFTVTKNGQLTGVSGGSDSLIINYGNKRAATFVRVAPDITTPKLVNTISFPQVGDQPKSNAFIALDATASSSAMVQFELVSGPAIISNGILQLTGTGAVTVRATAAGDAWFAAASPVTQTFNVVGALPVSLTNFTAIRSNPSLVQLHWATIMESNNQGFIVERRFENQAAFLQTGFVTSAATGGTSALPLLYQFNDTNNFAGNSYYRLRQVDLDGHVAYSAIKTVIGTGVAGIKLFPNPSAGAVTIQLTGTNKPLQAIITDAAGRIIRQPLIQPGTASIVVSLRSGVYFVTILDSQGSTIKYREKLVVLNP